MESAFEPGGEIEVATSERQSLAGKFIDNIDREYRDLAKKV